MKDNEASFLGTGWAFPPRVDPQTGRIAASSGDSDVRESIRIILLTAKGERVMRPEFGCGIHDLVFDTSREETLWEIERVVKEDLMRFERRINVQKVRAVFDDDAKTRISIDIEYMIAMSNRRDNVVFPFYLGGSA